MKRKLIPSVLAWTALITQWLASPSDAFAQDWVQAVYQMSPTQVNREVDRRLNLPHLADPAYVDGVIQEKCGYISEKMLNHPKGDNWGYQNLVSRKYKCEDGVREEIRTASVNHEMKVWEPILRKDEWGGYTLTVWRRGIKIRDFWSFDVAWLTSSDIKFKVSATINNGEENPVIDWLLTGSGALSSLPIAWHSSNHNVATQNLMRETCSDSCHEDTLSDHQIAQTLESSIKDFVLGSVVKDTLTKIKNCVLNNKWVQFAFSSKFRAEVYKKCGITSASTLVSD